MYWKRYWIFLLLLVCSIALDTAMDTLLGIGVGHMGQNIAFIFRMMDPIERTIVLALLLVFLRKPIVAAFGMAFGRKGGASGSTSDGTSGGASQSSGSNAPAASSGGGAATPPQPSDQQ
ncbi:hypothetical protein [Cohnella sp. GCM10027633]|uniref:hypothetical protein n=1 Tax=unclassified Cohnella TaxID=2636738 RepID=UPI003639E85F